MFFGYWLDMNLNRIFENLMNEMVMDQKDKLDKAI